MFPKIVNIKTPDLHEHGENVLVDLVDVSTHRVKNHRPTVFCPFPVLEI